MNTNNNNSKPRVIKIGKNNMKELQNGIIKDNNYNQKTIIDSYNTKNYGIQYIKKKLNFETNITFENNKKNISLFSSLNLNENQEEYLTNKSLKTIRGTKRNHLNLNNIGINNKNKFILNSSKISFHNNNKKNKKIYNSKQNGISLNKELDKFKNRIDNIMKVIEDFEINYIYSNENNKIKEEFNKIIKNKKYLNDNNNFSCSNKKININIKSNKKKIYYRESNTILLNKDSNKNRTVILKNNKFNLTNKNVFSSTKNIKNNNNNSILLNKNEKKKNYNKKQLNNNYNNSYNRRINYSSLIEVKSMVKAKTKKTIKENNKNNIDKNIINKSKPLTHHNPSKSNNIDYKKNIYNDKSPKEKEIINNTIYINPSYIKTLKLWGVKQKNKKDDKSKFNNINKKKG